MTEKGRELERRSVIKGEEEPSRAFAEVPPNVRVQLSTEQTVLFPFRAAIAEYLGCLPARFDKEVKTEAWAFPAPMQTVDSFARGLRNHLLLIRL